MAAHHQRTQTLTHSSKADCLETTHVFAFVLLPTTTLLTEGFACDTGMQLLFPWRGSWGWKRLPRGPGENACEAHATLSLGPGRGVATVVNVHLGNEGDTEMQVFLSSCHFFWSIAVVLVIAVCLWAIAFLWPNAFSEAIAFSLSDRLFV